MNPQELIEVARSLAESGRANPTQAHMRRAVSSAYYAMFHCLAASAADLFIGRTRTPAWHRIYRASDHGRARSGCRQAQTMPEFPVEIRAFAKAFVELQIERQQADYALDAADYQKSDVLDYIVSAERAISWFEQADDVDRRSFATQVLFRQRSP